MSLPKAQYDTFRARRFGRECARTIKEEIAKIAGVFWMIGWTIRVLCVLGELSVDFHGI